MNTLTYRITHSVFSKQEESVNERESVQRLCHSHHCMKVQVMKRWAHTLTTVSEHMQYFLNFYFM